jgi:cation diffusion facilitator family transporter
MSKEKFATIIATATAGFLVVIKLIVGILSGSVAVLASAIDSALDIAVSLFNYYTVRTVEKGSDEDFNYGRNKLEPLAAVVEGSIISISGLYILYESISKFIANEKTLYMQESILVMTISFIVTLFLVLYLNYVAKQTNSMVIRSDALHYKTDLYTNGAILLSLGLIWWSDFHLIDAILGAVIAVYIIYSAYGLIKEGVEMLLDKALDETIVKEIRTVLDKQEFVTSYHMLKTRKSANQNFVAVHLVFNVSISLFDAHRISDKIEAQIRQLDESASWNFAIHLDPYDDSAINEMEEG